MFETLSILPPGFWAVVALLIGGAIWAMRRMADGSGVPILAVLFTVAVWYVGDAFYNDYPNHHAKLFEAGVLQSAWWQVAWFLAVFLLAAPAVHDWINARHLRRGSGVVRAFRNGVNQPRLQGQLKQLFLGSLWGWGILALIAVVRLKGEALYYFCPYLGSMAEPWGRGRIGGGFDALLTVAFYLEMIIAGLFGVVAALSTNWKYRLLSLVLCFFSWPSFIFDRTRNNILTVVMPAILTWTLLRVRGGMLKKGLLLFAFFVLINSWFAFIIANRSNELITTAIREKGFSLGGTGENAHHEGLNMFEELCWINTLMDSGAYAPNWGSRYFAEAVNFVPRALWPGKPMIGIDYAMARGQGGGAAGGAGVWATMSTGLIGQGVVNFGRLLGPAAAALLMSMWVAALARLDLNMERLGRLPLYGLGMILTFNLGRDITLITLYSFIFGAIAVSWLERLRLPAAPNDQFPGNGRRLEIARRPPVSALPQAAGFPKRTSRFTTTGFIGTNRWKRPFPPRSLRRVPPVRMSP